MAGESGSFWQLERVNRRRTVWLVVAVILVLALFGLGYGLAFDFRFHNLRFSDGRLSGIPIFGPLFLALAGVSAVAHMIRANFVGADRVLGALGAHPISSDDPKNQAVIDVVREMALAARIPEPRIDVIDDPSPNAFATGRNPKHSVICVTQGLLDQMDREELQGVIAHETAHIHDYDTQLTTMVTAMFGGGVLHFIFGEREFLARIISIMLSREREYLADASAVEFTRNLAALIRALEHIAKTESPLRCATPGTAQLFIVDPFERADSGRSYQEFINEVTRIRSQPGKTEEQRDEEARNFAAHEYPRNFLVEKVSSHPPLRERIARLQALVGAVPGAAPASGVSDEQLRANFSTSARFVRHLAETDPEVLAKVMQAALVATAGGRNLLQQGIGGTQFGRESASRDPIEQKLYESNLASTGDLKPSRNPIAQGLYESVLASRGDLKPNEDGDSSLPPALAAEPASGKGIGLPDSAATEALEVEALARDFGPLVASLRPKKAATQHAAAERPSGSRGIFLFWIVIAISAGAIVAALATK